MLSQTFLNAHIRGRKREDMEEIKACILSAVVKLAQTMLKRVEFVENEKQDKEMFYTYIKGYRVLKKAGILYFQHSRRT